MSNVRIAAQLLLDVLERGNVNAVFSAASVLRVALAAPVAPAPQAVAYRVGRYLTDSVVSTELEHSLFPEIPIIPLYAAPVLADLTDEQIFEHYKALNLPHVPVMWTAALGTVRAILAAARSQS